MEDKCRKSVLIADDHQVIRDLVASFLEEQQAFETWHAGTFEETISSIAENGPFDIVLLDFQMPGMNGLQGVSEIIISNSPSPVVLFSGTDSQAVISGSMDLGARGLIPKSSSADEIPKIIREVISGQVYLPSGFKNLEEASSSPKLTRRESEILALLKEGKTNKVIGEILGISPATAKFHISGLCTKLGAKNRTQAVMMAEELGL